MKLIFILAFLTFAYCNIENEKNMLCAHHFNRMNGIERNKTYYVLHNFQNKESKHPVKFEFYDSHMIKYHYSIPRFHRISWEYDKVIQPIIDNNFNHWGLLKGNRFDMLVNCGYKDIELYIVSDKNINNDMIIGLPAHFENLDFKPRIIKLFKY